MIRILLGIPLLGYFVMVCIIAGLYAADLIELKIPDSSLSRPLWSLTAIAVHAVLFGLPGFSLIYFGRRARRRAAQRPLTVQTEAAQRDLTALTQAARLLKVQAAALLDQSRAAPKQGAAPTPAAEPRISYQCPHCGKKLRSKPEMSGKRVTCPGCKQTVPVPAGSPGAVTPAGVKHPEGGDAICSASKPFGKAAATPSGVPTAAPANVQPVHWTREGQAHDERLRARHGGFGEMKAVINIDDFGRNQNPGEFRVLASGLAFNNGVLSGDVPGDLSGTTTCHVLAAVGEGEAGLTTFRNNIEAGKAFLRSCFHQYPQYPLIHLSIMLPLDTAPDLTKVRATVVECVAQFMNADFQEWVCGLYKTRKTLIHVYCPDGQRLATGAVDLDPSFVNDLVQSVNDAEVALQKIAGSHRDYRAAVKQFYRDHPSHFSVPCGSKRRVRWRPNRVHLLPLGTEPTHHNSSHA